MDKSFKNVRSRLLLTSHGRDNLYGNRKDAADRSDISLNAISNTISKGIIGFSGSKKFKSTYKDIEVIWKYDKEKDLFVIITYYDKRQFNNKCRRRNKNFCLNN